MANFPTDNLSFSGGWGIGHGNGSRTDGWRGLDRSNHHDGVPFSDDRHLLGGDVRVSAFFSNPHEHLPCLLFILYICF